MANYDSTTNEENKKSLNIRTTRGLTYSELLKRIKEQNEKKLETDSEKNNDSQKTKATT